MPAPTAAYGNAETEPIRSVNQRDSKLEAATMPRVAAPKPPSTPTVK